MTLDELLAHTAIRGVSLKGCVEGGPKAMKGHEAHAHLAAAGRTRGWICLASSRHLNPTTVCHGLAHLVLDSDAHGVSWRRMVRQLGGRVERRYLMKN